MFLKYLNFFLVIIFWNNQLAIGTDKVEDAKYWHKNGVNYLNKILDENKLDGIDITKYKTKNIVFFLGDGMGINTISAARIYKGQLDGKQGEDTSLVFEKFPYIGLAKTYCIDYQVADSASTATALFTGTKTNYYYVGMDITATKDNPTIGKVSTFMEWAQKAGKFTGIVTTTRITHATPAATYAKVFTRGWECDSAIPNESRSYKDIARQLVEDSPGNKFNVIFGGGLTPMGRTNKNQKEKYNFTGSVEEVCNRTDSLDLIENWLKLAPTEKNKIRKFVQNRDDLLNINVKNISNILGIFRNNHMSYGLGRDENEPSLSEMVQQAIRVLTELSEANGNPGFVLMVEGGRIDHAHHNNYAHAALQEVVDMDDAVEVALKLTNQTETLTIVTADHSHSLTFNGNPKRGTDILGFGTAVSKLNHPYETLSYANGPAYYLHRTGLPTTMKTDNNLDNHDMFVPIEHLNKQTRMKPTYTHFAAIPLKDETHGGEDVPVFAMGPGSNLIRSTFEQNYLAIVMSYTTCIGPFKDINVNCNNDRSSGSPQKNLSMIYNLILILITLILNFL